MPPANLRDIDPLMLLPQRPPFVMIDHLLSCDETVTTTEFTIRQDNLFVEDDAVDACVLIENIAQTCAARMGYINRYVLCEGVKLGFIGSVRNLTVLAKPAVGDTITTTVTVREEVMKLTLVDAVVKDAQGNTIATAEMKIALSDIDAQELMQK